MQQPIRRPLQFAIAASLSLCLGLACTPQPQYPECKNDTICAQHEQVCVTGFCRGCRDDSQCLANEQCIANGCAKKPGPKAEPACEGGGCAPSAECSGDGECGMGKACVEGRCLAQNSLIQIYSGASLACVAGPIFFSFDDTALDQRARDAIAAAWTCMQGEGFRRIRLLGNTDERGTTEYNLALGSHRAEAVRKYLIGLGADGRKLRTVSFGKERPVDDGHDESAWAKNRRVELDLEK